MGNSLWNLSAYGAFLVLAIISAPIFIRYLGVARYGLLILLNSILTPMGLLNLGFAEATTKYVAESYGRGDIDEVGRYLRTTLLFNTWVGILGAVVIALIARFLATSVFKISPADQKTAEVALRWIAAGWLVTEVQGTFAAVPAALQRYRLVSVGNTIVQALNIGISMLVLALGGDLLVLIAARFCWSVASTIGWMLLDRRLLPGVSFWPHLDPVAFKRSFGYGIWQTVSTFGGTIGDQADKFLLGIYVSTSAVALFNIPDTIYSAGYIVVSKLGEVLFPAVSDLQGKGDNDRLRGMVLESTWLLVVLMSAIMGTVVVFAHDFLRLYMGNDIANQSSQIMQVLALQAFFSAASIGIHQYLRGTAHTPWLALISGVTGALIALVSILLVPRYGLAGAAWSQLVAILLSRPLIASLIWRSYWRDYKPWRVYMSYFYGPGVAGVLGAVLLLLARSRVAWQPGWIGLIFAGTVCALLLGGFTLAFDRLLPECGRRTAAFWTAMRILADRLPFAREHVLQWTAKDKATLS
jgi:O-antigen/teichoic acid export membrane protein